MSLFTSNTCGDRESERVERLFSDGYSIIMCNNAYNSIQYNVSKQWKDELLSQSIASCC